MKALVNKTQRPLKIPLPGGKTLRLAPGKSGEIRDDVLENPSVKKMIEAGDIEVQEGGAKDAGMVGGGILRNQAGGGQRRSTFRQRKGDR
jgi:hypothetical protein